MLERFSAPIDWFNRTVAATALAATVAMPAFLNGTPVVQAEPAPQSIQVPDGAPTDCGPPSEDIPGPPPWAINVGQPMSEAWLMCYVWQDMEGQDFIPERFGDVRETVFDGYPVECWNAELGPGADGTPGLVVPIYVHNRTWEQYILFTYRIQLDGDYINNCDHEFLDV
jgi:hypothetical protein